MTLCLLLRKWYVSEALKRNINVQTDLEPLYSLTVDHALRQESAVDAFEVEGYMHDMGYEHVSLRIDWEHETTHQRLQEEETELILQRQRQFQQQQQQKQQLQMHLQGDGSGTPHYLSSRIATNAVATKLQLQPQLPSRQSKPVKNIHAAARKAR